MAMPIIEPPQPIEGRIRRINGFIRTKKIVSRGGWTLIIAGCATLVGWLGVTEGPKAAHAMFPTPTAFQQTMDAENIIHNQIEWYKTQNDIPRNKVPQRAKWDVLPNLFYSLCQDRCSAEPTNTDGKPFQYSGNDNNDYLILDEAALPSKDIATFPRDTIVDPEIPLPTEPCREACRHLGYSNKIGFFGY